MFIKDTINNNELVFIKSKYIKAFPSGRRRAFVTGSKDTASKSYYIPFDPEARLNTEANHRKHTGLNGFSQTYLKDWLSDGTIRFVLGGYYFEISVPSESGTSQPDGFGHAVAEKLGITSGSIFANIKLASVGLLSDNANTIEAKTEILRDQSTEDTPASALDMLHLPADKSDSENPDYYYFHGLSFSKEAKTGDVWVSLQLLDYDGEHWVIHEASRLPEIKHGDAAKSVEIPGDLLVENNLTVNGYINTTIAVTNDDGDPENLSVSAVFLDVPDLGNGYHQLRFYTKTTQE